jgi:benzoyl-CoA reductase/2-hydroxyglutaryl-CoA dehydratase subunit BcrC/BadD/HgdB
MIEEKPVAIGVACAYTPLALIRAAGGSPYRVLSMGQAPNQAGQLLHDNLCPHVKRILDRSMANELPALAGMLFVNSCDAMRRLCDAWKKAWPMDNLLIIDFPSASDPAAVSFLADEYRRLRGEGWPGAIAGGL